MTSVGSSLYQVMSTCQKENLKGKLCMPLTKVFQIGVGVNSTSVKGYKEMGNFAVGLIYMVVET